MGHVPLVPSEKTKPAGTAAGETDGKAPAAEGVNVKVVARPS